MRLARTAAPLAAILAAQWVAVLLLAINVTSDDAGRLRTVIDVLVLLPLALVCVYLVGSQLSGRGLGIFAAALWAFLPFAAVPLFDPRYRDLYVDGFLVQAVGLTDVAAFPAMVALAVAALLAALSLRGGQVVYAGGAGLSMSLAFALDASAVLVAAAPALALLAARRWPGLSVYCAALLPGGLLLVLRSTSLPGLPGDDWWTILQQNGNGIREFFWSLRVLQWLPVAGVLGVARRSPPLALLLGLWFAAYLISRGTDEAYTIGQGAFFPGLLPALPAYVLLSAAIPLLAPPLPSMRNVAYRLNPFRFRSSRG